jgi:7tm Chemosensory receptor
MKIIIYMCFTIFIETMVVLNIQTDRQWVNFWYAEIYSLIVTRVRYTQHVFFIDLIFFTLKDMNRRLSTLTLWTMGAGCERKFAKRNFHVRLRATMEQFKNLMEMIICVNKIFRWSTVLNVGQHFLEITCELYWIYAFANSDNFLWRMLRQFAFF